MRLQNNILVPDWAGKFDIVCGFTLPFYGNQALTRVCRSGNMETNRRKFCDALGLDVTRIFAPHQVHGNKVLLATNENAGHGAFGLDNADDGDACITKEKGVTLITTWADCIPIILFDCEQQIVAAIHSGWRGTAQNVVKQTVCSMNSIPANIFASVGPGIRGCCYEVGAEVAQTFLQMGECISRYVSEQDGHYKLDLQSVVYAQLLECNIPSEQIDRCQLCTCCSENPSFFSCRKDGKENFEGQAAFICMK